MIGVDADKNPIDITSVQSVVSPDSKVEGVNGEIPTENGNNNVTEDDVSKVSCEFSYQQQVNDTDINRLKK